MLGRTQLSRRTVLRGLGTAMALPLFEGMIPRTVLGAAAPSAAPARMAFLYVANGMHMPDWTPEAEGELKLSKTLESLADHRHRMHVLSGLTLNGGRALGDGPGDHARSVASFLTGAHPRKTEGKDIKNGISVDQVAAGKVGHLTRFASLELGCEPSAQSGNCDSGYSCMYTSNMSWRSETQPMTKEINPRSLFDRLFGNADDVAQQKSRAMRDAERKSILDFVMEDVRGLEGRLGATDKQKLDEYLHAVRQVERRIEESENLATREIDVPDFPRPAGVPRDNDEHIRLMMDMMTLAFATDSTRVLTFMYTNDSSNRSYKQLGVPEGHHDLSHHGRNADKQAKIATINRHHVSHLKYFLDKLASIKENESTLLDHSMIVYGSGIGDGDRHNHDDLPVLLVGSGGGVLITGQHTRYKADTPMTNLYVSMLNVMGATTEKLADSTGQLENLRV